MVWIRIPEIGCASADRMEQHGLKECGLDLTGMWNEMEEKKDCERVEAGRQAGRQAYNRFMANVSFRWEDITYAKSI